MQYEHDKRVSIAERPSGSVVESRLYSLLLWAPLVAFVVTAPMMASEPIKGAFLLAIFGNIFAFLHGVPRYGWKGMIVLLVSCLVVSFSMENISIANGFPFGHYHYTLAGPKIIEAPIVVGPLYFAVGYLSWTTANALLGLVDGIRRTKLDLVALPIGATFAMVQWDVVMDPSQSTLAKAWIWHQGGGYFGVPLTNFLGWFLTVWIFYQIFSLFLARGPQTVNDQAPRLNTRMYWIAPIVFYLFVALSYILPYAMDPKGSVIDATGAVWNVDDLRETSVIILLFTMVPTSFFALYRTIKNSRLV